MNVLHDLRYALRQLRRAPGLDHARYSDAGPRRRRKYGDVCCDRKCAAAAAAVRSLRSIGLHWPKSDQPGFEHTSWLNYRDVRDQSRQLARRFPATPNDVSVAEINNVAQSVVAPRLTPNACSGCSGSSRCSAAPLPQRKARLAAHMAAPAFGRTLATKLSTPTRTSLGARRKSAACSARWLGSCRIHSAFRKRLARIFAGECGCPCNRRRRCWRSAAITSSALLVNCARKQTITQAQAELDAIALHIRQADPKVTVEPGISRNALSGSADRGDASGPLYSVRSSGAGAADCLRKCFQPSDCALRWPTAGIFGACRTRGKRLSPDPSGAGRGCSPERSRLYASALAWLRRRCSACTSYPMGPYLAQIRLRSAGLCSWFWAQSRPVRQCCHRCFRRCSQHEPTRSRRCKLLRVESAHARRAAS
jgi:hypothetical protein